MWHEHVRRRVWAALALALAGLTLVAEVWEDARLDTVGVAAGLLASGALATYFLAGEHATARRDALSLTCISLGVAAAFWAVVQPWWGFPFDELWESVSLQGAFESTTAPVWLLSLWMIVLGTIVPFALSLGALHHLPATRVSIVAMVEVVLAVDRRLGLARGDALRGAARSAAPSCSTASCSRRPPADASRAVPLAA